MGKFIDLTGQRFGRWTVIGFEGRDKWGHSKWSCLCDCSNKKVVGLQPLQNGESKSCGCYQKEQVKIKKRKHRYIDLTGKKYSMLLVVKFDHVDENSRAVFWECLCECGNKKIINGSGLKSGSIKSCGCYGIKKRREAWALPLGESSKNKLYADYKRSAQKRNIDFDLEFNLFINITKKDCFYCGRVASQISTSKDLIGEYVYNGIDRVDSSIGYIKNNVVPCCQECNYAKNNTPQQDFLDWIKRVYEYSIAEKE